MIEKYIEVYNPILDKVEKVLLSDLRKSLLLENMLFNLNNRK